jgi:hypothetical protein
VDTVDPRHESSCERLESDENLAFQHRSWRWETFGRWAVALVVICALAGLLGSGPLSRGEVTSADGRFRVEYPRIARTDATYRISVYASPRSIVNGEIRLWIDAELLKVVQVEAVTPQPESVELDRGRILHRFRVAADGELAPIMLHVKTDGVGRHAGEIGLGDGGSVKLTFWIFP